MLKWLGRLILLLVVLTGAGLGVALWLDRPGGDPVVGKAHRGKGQDFALIERGRYLVDLGDCAACHTSPGQSQKFAGGRPIETPFGVVAAPNITPDVETGIGGWTDAQFDAALRHGKKNDGRHLYPAMPYVYYTHMDGGDIEAMRAYLDTVPPVHNAIVVNRLPFPLNIRSAMLVWNALYFKDARFKSNPAKLPEWNRGAFLVNGPGHCGACHTPKSVLGGDEKHRFLQGNTIQGWYAPDITNDDQRGLGRWSSADVVAYLKTGHNRAGGAVGPMAEEVTISSSHMRNEDLEAIATYLKSLPGRNDQAVPLPTSNNVVVAGAAIYRDQCSACHAPDGKGVANLFPDLTQSSALRSDKAATLIRIVLQGARSAATTGEPTGPAMPSFAWQLDDAQAAAVLTYVRNSWGAAAAAVTSNEVRSARAALQAR